MALNKDENNLLDTLIADQKKIDRRLYSAGPYWDYKGKKICYWLKKKGMEDFRGLHSGVGTSFTDNLAVDVKNEMGFRGRLISKIFELPILKVFRNEQVNLNLNTTNALIKYKRIFYEQNNKVSNLLAKYKIEDTIRFGCVAKFSKGNKEYSMTYLDMCERIDNINKFINFSNIKNYLEIGGGFGANIHLLIQNFKNIKKFAYVDIVPNLFVGTEYLRSLFGNSVKDYLLYRDKEKIEFENNQNLEIICIPPWKLQNFNSKIDSFHNAASFQEMTIDQVKNYYFLLKKLFNKTSISLIIYKGWSKNNTLNPNQINEIFDNELKVQEFENLGKRDSQLIYLISEL